MSYCPYIIKADVEISAYKRPIVVKHIAHNGNVVENQITDIVFDMLAYDEIVRDDGDIFRSYVEYIHLSDVVEESLLDLLQLGVIEKECAVCNNTHYIECDECTCIEDDQYCCTLCWGSKKVDCLDCKTASMNF